MPRRDQETSLGASNASVLRTSGTLRSVSIKERRRASSTLGLHTQHTISMGRHAFVWAFCLDGGANEL